MSERSIIEFQDVRYIPDSNNNDLAVEYILRQYGRDQSQPYMHVFEQAPVSSDHDVWQRLETSASYRDLVDKRPAYFFGQFGAGKTTMSRHAQIECSAPNNPTLAIRMDLVAPVYVYALASGRHPTESLHSYIEHKILNSLLVYGLDLLVLMHQGESGSPFLSEIPLDEKKLRKTIKEIGAALHLDMFDFRNTLSQYDSTGCVPFVENTQGVHPKTYVDDRLPSANRHSVVMELIEEYMSSNERDASFLVAERIPQWVHALGKSNLWLHIDGLDGLEETESAQSQAHIALSLATVVSVMKTKTKEDVLTSTIFAPALVQQFLRPDQIESYGILSYSAGESIDMLDRYIDMVLGSGTEIAAHEKIFDSLGLHYFLHALETYRLPPRIVIDMFMEMCRLQDRWGKFYPISPVSVVSVVQQFETQNNISPSFISGFTP